MFRRTHLDNGHIFCSSLYNLFGAHLLFCVCQMLLLAYPFDLWQPVISLLSSGVLSTRVRPWTYTRLPQTNTTPVINTCGHNVSFFCADTLFQSFYLCNPYVLRFLVSPCCVFFAKITRQLQKYKYNHPKIIHFWLWRVFYICS